MVKPTNDNNISSEEKIQEEEYTKLPEYILKLKLAAIDAYMKSNGFKVSEDRLWYVGENHQTSNEVMGNTKRVVCGPKMTTVGPTKAMAKGAESRSRVKLFTPKLLICIRVRLTQYEITLIA